LNTLDGRYEFYAKLEDIQKRLDGGFFRCHKSFIVNVKNIREFDVGGKEIIMKDGSRCLVAVRKLSKLKEYMKA
jgi:two-component system response regulator AgrA